MKVLFICEDEADAQFVRDNHETLEEALSGALFWRTWPEFTVVASMMTPTYAELRALIEASEGESYRAAEGIS
jgi:hypothetical protein